MKRSTRLDVLAAQFHDQQRERTEQAWGPLQGCLVSFFESEARSGRCASCGRYLAGFVDYLRTVGHDEPVLSVLGTFGRDWVRVCEEYFVSQVGTDSFGLTAVELFRWPDRCLDTETLPYVSFFHAVVVDAVACELLAVEMGDLTSKGNI